MKNISRSFHSFFLVFSPFFLFTCNNFLLIFRFTHHEASIVNHLTDHNSEAGKIDRASVYPSSSAFGYMPYETLHCPSPTHLWPFLALWFFSVDRLRLMVTLFLSICLSLPLSLYFPLSVVLLWSTKAERNELLQWMQRGINGD